MTLLDRADTIRAVASTFALFAGVAGVGLANGCGTNDAGIVPDALDGGDAAASMHGDGATPMCADGATCAPSRCSKDGDCPSGNICASHACVVGCHSGRDCPSDKKLCDAASGPNGACVACIQNGDCSAGDSCVAGACLKTCAADVDCPGAHCKTTTHVCVACVTKDQCPIGDVCAADTCVAGCDGDRDCPQTSPKCNASAAPHGACVQCLANVDCGQGFACSQQHACAKACGSDVDCVASGAGQHCNVATQQCVECTDKTQCALGNLCVESACTPGCTGDRDCPVDTPRCDPSAAPHGSCVGCVGDQDCNGGKCTGGTCHPVTGAPALVQIPAGSFTMGSNALIIDGGVNDTAEHVVSLSAYSIEKYEVTNDAYRACVTAAACLAPRNRTDFDNTGKKNNPVTFVTWEMANQFCQWEGRRLPTEAEWEYAARGSDKRTYEWGSSTPTCALVNAAADLGQPCTNALADVGLHPTGVSVVGAEDMGGNAREWAEDWYVAYSSAATSDPHGPPLGTNKLARGGSWVSVDADLTTFTRPTRGLDSADGYIGFRCAKSSGTVAAAFTASASTAVAGAAITVDASGSSDPIDPASLLMVRWDFNDDGVWETPFSTTKTSMTSFPSPGVFTIVMEVQNTRGDTERALRVVRVGPTSGGDGAPCSTMVACATNFVCETSVCRAQCTGPGDTCPTPTEACQMDPLNFFNFVCL